MATTNFPTSLDTTSSLPNPGSGDITTNPSHASQHDVENDALRAIEAKVGIGASTPTANKVLRATGMGTTAYAQVGLTTDVTGTLPIANGGTGITSLGSGVATFLGTPSSANLASAVTDGTGTGVLVFGTSPTIVTPTIASFTNAQHNHSNAAGGGQLPTGAANAVVATSETTTSTSYTNLTTTTDGVTVTIGVNGIALIAIQSFISNNTSSAKSYVSVDVSGASTIAATDTTAIYYQVFSAGSETQASDIFMLTGLTAGSTVFKMKYRVDTGGGGSGTGTFKNRRIAVIPL